ncbi:MAG: hypothetical protein WCB11_04090, partial [Terriglobales bacterium]
AGTLLLEGLTVPEMQQAVSGAYRSFLREPSPRPVFVARDRALDRKNGYQRDGMGSARVRPAGIR